MAKRIISDKILKDKAYEISTDPKHDGYQQRMVNLMYKHFEKKKNINRSKCKWSVSPRITQANHEKMKKLK